MRKILLSAVLFIAAAGVFAQNLRVENTENLRRNVQMVQEAIAVNAVEFEMNAVVKPKLDRVVSRQAAVLSEVQIPQNPVLQDMQVRSANVVFSENFDATTGVALPAGWVRTPETTTLAMSHWVTTIGVNLGGNNFMARAGRSAMFITPFPHPGTEGWLVSAGMNLTAGVEYTLTFNIAGWNDGAGDFDRLSVILATNNSMPMVGGTTLFQSNAATFPTMSMAWGAVSVNFTAVNTGTHYLGFHINNSEDIGWFLGIDDIVVTEVLPNALAIGSVFRYTHVPVSQITPPLSANVRNAGTATQTNVVFSAELNGADVGITAPFASLAPDASTNLIITPTVNPVLGSNTLVYTVNSAEGAETNAAFTFTGTENFFAQDISGPGWSLGHSAPISLGNIFTITTETQLNQVQIAFNPAAPGTTNTEAYTVSVFRMEGGVPQLPALFTSPVANRTTAGGTVNVDVYEVLEPGSYFVAVNQLGTTTMSILAANDPDRTGYFILGASFGSIKTGFGQPDIGPIRLRLITNVVCDPVTTFPFFESFENGIPACWLNVDADGDGHSWEGLEGVAISFSWLDDALTPDNWLITPQLVLGANDHTLCFVIATLDPNFPTEHYSVLVSTTDTQLSSFTEIHSATLTAADALAAGGKEVTLDLSAFSGQSIYIAFRHWHSTDNFGVVLFDVLVSAELAVISLSPADGAVNVALNADVIVTFNQPVVISDLSGITFSPAVTGVSANVNGAVLTITHDGFEANTVYSLTILPGAVMPATAGCPGQGGLEAITWSFTATADDTVGLPDDVLTGIQIYPNPVGNEMQIQSELPITRIDVIDMQGRVVLHQQGGNTVNMQPVAPGIYTVQIHTEAGVVPIRIVKK